MENRKRMYKAGPRENPTLTDRVKDNRNRRKDARMDNFAATRKISVSPGTPTKATTLISGIADRKQKLKAYRVAKNTKKFIEMQEQRSPFIVAVPTGRWVEKKERAPAINFRLNDTPVRAALASERILKKSTVKNLISKSTAKKENMMVFGAQKGSSRPQSKKQILAELNAVSQSNELSDQVDLNDTFEVLPEMPDSPAFPTSLRRSVSLPHIASPPKAVIKLQKASTPPVKTVARKEALVNTKPVVKAAVKRLATKSMPLRSIPMQMTKKAIVQKVESKKVAAKVEDKKVLKPVRAMVAAKKPTAAAVIKKPVARPQKPSVEVQSSVVVNFPISEVVIKPVATVIKPIKAKEPARSKTYNTYKSSIHIQSSFLTMQISNVTNNMEAYIELLSEDDQTFLHKTVQQGNLIVSEKLPKFGEFLEKFEEGLCDQNDPKRLTDDDVENYWYLIYDEIEKLKEDLTTVLEKKKKALAIVASQKKRRTRRTYVPDEGTPKRSRRIAENADTPKHNASCYGCVPMSATKLNTPKSTNKRRTTNKKSTLFDAASETPKRSSRRSSKKSAAAPKRSLIRMNAVDDEDLDLTLEMM